MKNEVRNRIENIIAGAMLSDDSGNNESITVFRHYNDLKINENDLIGIISKLNLDSDMVYKKFQKKNIDMAFSPFLEFIRELYNKYYSDTMTPQKFISEANVYKVVASMFVSYLKNGTIKRNEDFIIQEMFYEKERILESLANILEYISRDHGIVIVLDNFNAAQLSTISLVKKIIKENKYRHKIALIISYNESYIISKYKKSVWDSLLDEIRIYEVAIEYDTTYDFDEIGIQNDNLSADEADENDESDDYDGYIEKKKIKEDLPKIADMIDLLAVEEADYYLNIIRGFVEDNNINIHERERIRLYYLLSLINSYTGKDKLAYLYCSKMYNYPMVKKNNNLLFDYYYARILGDIKSGQSNMSLMQLEEAYNIFDIENHKDKFVRLKMLEGLAYMEKNPDVLSSKTNNYIPEDVVEIAIKYKQRMHLAYIYLFGFDPIYFTDEKTVISTEDRTSDENINTEEFKKGLEIAIELDNVMLQLRGWQGCAVLASIHSQFKDILYFYNKCFDIMRGNDMKKSEAQVYNGLGYNCMINEKILLAFKYYKKAIALGMKLGEPEPIIDGIYNLATLDIMVGNYEETVKCVKLALNMMSESRLTRLNVCNKSKVYGLGIFASIKLGQIYNAKLYYDSMKTVMQHILSSDNPDYSMWEDDVYLYYVVSGMLNIRDENFKEAKENFENANILWNEINSKQLYIYSRVIEEEVMLAEILGEEENKKKLIKDAKKFCKDSKLAFNVRIIESIGKKNKDEETEYKPVLTDKMFMEINELIGRYALKSEVEKKNKMIDFFEKWVDNLNNGWENNTLLMYNSMELLKNTFGIDAILHIRVENNIPAVVYNDSYIDLQSYQIRYIYDHFNKNRRRIIVSRLEKSYKIYEDFVSVFNINDISAMLAIPFMDKDELTDIFVAFRLKKANYTENLVMFYDEDADIIRTAIRELIMEINKESIKKQLEQSSVTDALTGINNRHGMISNILKQIEEMHESGITGMKYTVLYMDLDNFKYCNDNFGHDAGDAVLVAFSNMLNTVVENAGFVVRYGGDEFIVILPGREEDFGAQIAKKIFRNISYTRGFKKAIQSTNISKLEITNENSITCSIGIASGNVREYNDLSIILRNADLALHIVKKKSKKDYLIWNEDLESKK